MRVEIRCLGRRELGCSAPELRRDFEETPRGIFGAFAFLMSYHAAHEGHSFELAIDGEEIPAPPSPNV